MIEQPKKRHTMAVLDQSVIDKYRCLSRRLADPALIGKLGALFERRYTLVELLAWVHERLKWDDGEIERHNDPLEILAYGKGKCGEFSILFTAVCLAHGYRTRIILDTSDHVWSEVWHRGANRWVHVDPSDSRIDDPLMYERDWGKTLAHVYAFENGKMEEVTKKYKVD